MPILKASAPACRKASKSSNVSIPPPPMIGRPKVSVPVLPETVVVVSDLVLRIASRANGLMIGPETPPPSL